jgi:hypothetical protein
MIASVVRRASYFADTVRLYVAECIRMPSTADTVTV